MTDIQDVASGVDQLVTLLARLLPQEALSLTAASTLATLERSGPLRLTDLATRQAVSQPAMTGLVRRLTALGLLGREPDAADRRSVRVDLTPAGRRVLAARRHARAQALAARIAALDHDDQAALAAAVPAITRLVSAGAAQ